MKLITTFLVLFLCIGSLHIYGQQDSVKIFYMPEMRVIDNHGKKNEFHFIDYETNELHITKDSLLVDMNLLKYKVDINDINKVLIRNGSNYWNVAAWTGGVGFVLGFFAGAYFNIGDGHAKFDLGRGLLGGAILAVPFGLIGGLFGLFSPHFDEYDFTDRGDKYKYLLKVFNENQVKKRK